MYPTLTSWPKYEVSNLHSIFEIHNLLLTFFTDSSYALLIDIQFRCSQRTLEVEFITTYHYILKFFPMILNILNPN